MDAVIQALPWSMGALILIIALVALRRPLKWLLGLAARTGVGLAVLYALSYAGGFLGLSLGVNLVNALVLGLLGLPGFGLLVMINWILAV